MQKSLGGLWIITLALGTGCLAGSPDDVVAAEDEAAVGEELVGGRCLHAVWCTTDYAIGDYCAVADATFRQAERRIRHYYRDLCTGQVHLLWEDVDTVYLDYAAVCAEAGISLPLCDMFWPDAGGLPTCDGFQAGGDQCGGWSNPWPWWYPFP